MKGKELPGVKVRKGTVRTGMNTHKWGGIRVLWRDFAGGPVLEE